MSVEEKTDDVTPKATIPTSGRLAGVPLLGQEAAKQLDVDLMSTPGFSVDQLMELAGLSVAMAIPRVYPPATHSRVLVLAGPGNNGGDGLVAARHLVHFGYSVDVVYPKRPDARLFNNLVAQTVDMGIAFVDIPDDLKMYNVILDAIFGFSFHGALRAPFDALVSKVADCTRGSTTGRPALVSVDIPSGWEVEAGDPSGTGLRPDMLVSLSAPKLSAVHFEGPHHFLGGRFLPPSVRRTYGLEALPPYAGVDQVVELP